MFKSIEYPNFPKSIVLIGWIREYGRSFTVRPNTSGTFSLFIWPRGAPSLDWATEYRISFSSVYDDPQRLEFDSTKKYLPKWFEWDWALVKQGSGRPSLGLSDAVFGGDRVAWGRFDFAERMEPQEVRTLIWSCNQPYVTTELGEGMLNTLVSEIMPWYQRTAIDFHPSTIWGLGDTAYSDGTKSTDFTDQVYNTPGWELDQNSRQSLKNAYRNMFRHHWSFSEMQYVMGNFPHIMSWDDHEIHDGYGSEELDFTDGNIAMFEIAREVSDKYILNCGPRIRTVGDAHQAYILGSQANFIFDSRSSRNYADSGGQIISQEQLEDFRSFCESIIDDQNVKFLILGTTVPFIYLKDSVVGLGSIAPKELTDLLGGVRDDLRDSWRSPGNELALREIISILRLVLVHRSDLNVLNVSGDVHVSNAFQIWPIGFTKPFYQITSSALTNREHLSELASEVLELDDFQIVSDLGIVRRIWPEIRDPNLLCIRTVGSKTHIELKVLPVDGSKAENQYLSLG